MKPHKRFEDFTTSDLELAVTLLTAGHEFTTHKFEDYYRTTDSGGRRGAKIIFAFKFTTELQDSLDEYMGGRVMVSASELFANFRKVKSLVANYQQMDSNRDKRG